MGICSATSLCTEAFVILTNVILALFAARSTSRARTHAETADRIVRALISADPTKSDPPPSEGKQP